MLLLAMALCAALCVTGLLLMVASRNDLAGKPQKERAFNLTQFSLMPVRPTRLAPIPDRSTRWQIGLGLLIYPAVGLGVTGLLWLEARH